MPAVGAVTRRELVFGPAARLAGTNRVRRNRAIHGGCDRHEAPTRSAGAVLPMDVTCTRCGTTYEFEEGLVSTTGTTVKCTHCGHLFKLHRGSETATLPDPPAELRWRVRRADGSVHTLQSLADLTPLISAGQFRREDELSRTGQVWRRLGEVAELVPLFEGGRARLRSDPPPFTPPLGPPPPMPSERAESRRISDPPPPPSELGVSARARRQSGFESMGSPVDLLAPSNTPLPPPPVRAVAGERASVPLPPRASEPARVPLPKPALSPVPSPAPAAPAPVAVAAAAAAPGLDALSENEPQLQPPRPRLWLWVLVVSVVLAGAGAGISRLFVPAPAVDSPARALLARGDAELATHRTERFEPAITAYTQALQYHRDDAHILSSISRVYAVWAQALRDATPQPATGALPDGPEVRRLAERAKLYGERAAQRNPGNEEASVALSDAYRLTGNKVGARTELDHARATEGVPAAETLRVAALLAIEEAYGELQAGRALAEQAVAQDPSLIRARFLLARCLARVGDLEGAELHLDAVRKLDPSHPRLASASIELKALARANSPDAAAGPPAGVVASAPGDASTAVASAPLTARREGGSTSANADPAKPAAGGAPGVHAGAQPAPKPATPAPAEPKSANAVADKTAIELAQRGEALAEKNELSAAARAFNKALEIEPGLARAKVGLGYLALENAQPGNAVGLFRAAASGGSSEAWIGLGAAYRQLGKLRSALSAYRSYVSRFPRGESVSIARHQIELLTEQLSTSSPDESP